MRQKRTVRASSVSARRGVWLGWAICCSLVRGDYDGPFLSRSQSTQHTSSSSLLRAFLARTLVMMASRITPSTPAVSRTLSTPTPSEALVVDPLAFPARGSFGWLPIPALPITTRRATTASTTTTIRVCCFTSRIPSSTRASVRPPERLGHRGGALPSPAPPRPSLALLAALREPLAPVCVG